MKESLIKIYWSIDPPKDEGFSWYEIDYNEENDKVIYISLQGVDFSAQNIIDEMGFDIFVEEDYKLMVLYIKELMNPSLDILLKTVGEITHGEFISVINIRSFKSNHPMDPEEWDLEIDFLGILGKEVKLVY